MEIEGEVFTGLGEGADYIGMNPYQDRLEDIVGFYPYAGTLNLEVDKEKLQKIKESQEPQVVDSFTYEGSEYSGLDVYKIKISGVDAAYLDIEITDHDDDVMEVIAENKLREKLDLEDGDSVEVTFR